MATYGAVNILFRFGILLAATATAVAARIVLFINIVGAIVIQAIASVLQSEHCVKNRVTKL